MHELNRGFEWSDHRGPTRLLTEEEVDRFDTDGFLLLEEVIPSDVVHRVISEIDPHEAEVEAFLGSVDGGKVFIARAGEITFTTHLVLKSPYLAAFTRSGVFRDLCSDLIGPDVRLYWDQSVYKKPGTEAPFPWHQDNGYTYIEPQAYLTCWVALTEATVENGCPWVVPGIHRHGTLAHELSDTGFVCLDEAPEAVPVPAPAGSIVVFSSLTPHCTGPNTSDQVRKAYIVQYAPEGAAALTPGPDGSITREPANDPDRQFPVLVGGTAVDGSPDTWPA